MRLLSLETRRVDPTSCFHLSATDLAVRSLRTRHEIRERTPQCPPPGFLSDEVKLDCRRAIPHVKSVCTLERGEYNRKKIIKVTAGS